MPELALFLDTLRTGACEHEFGEGRAPAGGIAAEDARVGAPQEASTYQGYGAKESDYRPERWKGYRDDYGFTGKEEDAEFGIVYFGRRFYSPGLNRWLSPDPLAVHSPGEADLNLYAYVHGRIFSSTDPLGLEDAPEPPSVDVKSVTTDAKGAKTIEFSEMMVSNTGYLTVPEEAPQDELPSLAKQGEGKAPQRFNVACPNDCHVSSKVEGPWTGMGPAQPSRQLDWTTP